MSHYSIEELIKLWANQQVTAEQAIGQLLLHTKEILKRLAEIEREQYRVRRNEASS